MTWKERAICQGKTAFTSYDKAERQIRRKGYEVDRKDHGKLRPYRCPYCAMWHVGGASDMDEMRKYRWDK